MQQAGDAKRVWFVTGGGRGIGRELVEAALDAGECVAATVRDRTALEGLVATHPDRVQVAVVDVRERDAVGRAVDAAVDRFGRLDVVVNNAGYGLVGAIEEVTEQEARAIVDTEHVRGDLGHASGAASSAPAGRGPCGADLDGRWGRGDAALRPVQREQVGTRGVQ